MLKHLLASASALALLVTASWLERPGRVGAGTALRLDVEEVAQAADLIVLGRVSAARALRAGNGRIDTEYLIAVEHTFLGEPAATRAVRLPGGVLPDGSGMLLPGVSLLTLGEDVLLLLSEAGDEGARMPVGLAQGKYRIARAADGRRVALRSQAGLELVGADGRLLRHADALAVHELAELRARIEAALARRRAASGRGR